MAGEDIAFSDILAGMGVIDGRRIPVRLFTDWESLFDVVSKGSQTPEKRTMLYITAAREGFGNKVISDIEFTRRSKTVEDVLTKSIYEIGFDFYFIIW